MERDLPLALKDAASFVLWGFPSKSLSSSIRSLPGPEIVCIFWVVGQSHFFFKVMIEMGARGGEFEPGMSVLVGRLLFWTCLFVCSSQIPCCPNCICVTCTSRPAMVLSSPAFVGVPRLREGVGSCRRMFSVVQTGLPGSKMLSRSNIPRGSSQVQNSTFLLEQNLRFSWGRCVMPCLKRDLCVCWERRARRANRSTGQVNKKSTDESPNRSKTSAANLPFCGWSGPDLRVNLSQCAPVSVELVQVHFCNQTPSTVADGPGSFCLPLLAKYSTDHCSSPLEDSQRPT